MTTFQPRTMVPYAVGETIYQLFLRVFTPEGTLRAAEKQLPHLKRLGVRIVYLCPVVEADDDPDRTFWSDRQKASGIPNAKNPYRLKNFFKVDPEYGTDADLKHFVERAHKLGLKVLLDLVYFHCGPNADPIHENPEYVVRKPDGSVELGRWHFPAFNFKSPALREYLWGNMEYFIRDVKVDGFRCDVSEGVPLDFWEEGRRRCEKINPEYFMLGESVGSPAEETYAFDCCYGYSPVCMLCEVMTDRTSVKDYRDRLMKFYQEHENIRTLTGIENHDVANDCVEKRPDRVSSAVRNNAAFVMAYALPGIPMLYNGEEVADSAIHSLWTSPAHTPRRLIDWQNALTPTGRTRFNLLRKLIQMRKAQKPLQDGSIHFLETDAPEKLIAFLRESPEGRVLAVINLSKKKAATAIPSSFDLSGTPLIARGMKRAGNTLTLSASGYVLIPC